MEELTYNLIKIHLIIPSKFKIYIKEKFADIGLLRVALVYIYFENRSV